MAGRASERLRGKSGRGLRWFKRGLVLFGIFFLGLTIFGLSVWTPIYQKAVRDASDINNKLVVYSSTPSTVVASDGTLLYKIVTQRRTKIDVSTLPKFVRDAIVAAEDRRFYDHHGVDYRGLFRSMFVAVKHQHTSQGASTIEMQLAKMLVNGDERTFQRKLKDIATAQQIENLKSKDQILDLYMNEAYFGEGAYGIEAAAQTYFDRHAAQLDISQAALLARCVRHPSRENPVADYDGSLDRRNYVLGVMQEEGWINQQEYESAVAENPKISKDATQGIRYLNGRAGHFVDQVLAQFHEDNPSVDLKAGGYKIETTLNWKLQQRANQAVASTLRENRGRRVNDAALMIMDSDGKILAEVGGPDYKKRKLNHITQSHRQPGSSFKPFVYAAALKEGVIHMGDTLSNEAIYEDRYGVKWEPKNNGTERIGGTFSLRSAFINSVNLPAIHTIQKVTPETVVSYAKDTFGFTSTLHKNESLAIGTSEVYPIEMARAYSVFMLRGVRAEPYAIEAVYGPDGNIIKEYHPNKINTGFDPAICDDIDSLMRDVVTSGTGTAAADVPDARGKTGTTQDAKDAWFCGYSDGLVGIGWVGNSVPRKGRTDASRPMASSVYGGTVTAGMWAKAMMAAHQIGLAHQPGPPPERLASRAEKPHHSDSDEDTSAVPKDDPNATNPDIPPISPDTSTAPDDSAPTVAVPDQPAKPKWNVKEKKVGDQPGQAPDSTTVNQPASIPSDTGDDSSPPPRKTSQKKKSEDDNEYVSVEICADTGMRATRYCPETTTVKFRKGTEPRQSCRLHTGN